MSHIDKIKDADAFFEVNRITRQIINRTPNKIVLMQKDHNSERFTFSLPRYIEGHDMSESKAKLHYINAIKDIKGMYEMKDLRVDPDDSEKVICSWLISGNATKEAGALSFMIEFECYEGDVLVYSWHTQPHNGISVGEGFDNAEEIAEMYADVLQQWHDELFGMVYENGSPYIVSPDAAGKTVHIHELKSGAYIFQGTFNFGIEEVKFDRATACDVYKHADRAYFLTYLEAHALGVDVVKKEYVWAEGTSPDELHCETYRYNIPDLKSAIERVDDAAEKTDNKLKTWNGENINTDTYPSTLVMYEAVNAIHKFLIDGDLGKKGKIKTAIDNATNNVLKGVASGETVAMTDISPVDHTLKVKASSKNLFNSDPSLIGKIKYVSSSGVYEKYGYEIALPPGTYTISATPKETPFSDMYLYGYVLNKDNRVVGSNIGPVANNACKTKTFTVGEGEKIIQIDATTGDLAHAKLSFDKFDIMLEEGTTATEYTPYVPDVSSAKIITFGRNLFNTEGATLGELLQDDITTDGNASYITTDYIPVFKGMKGNFEFDLDGLFWDSCFAYDENLNFISSIDIALISLSEAEEDFPDGTRYIRFVLAKEDYSEFTLDEFEDFKNSKCQLVLGEVNKQPYEPYNGFMAYPITSDGTVEEIKSIYPTMTIVADIPGMVISADYNRDINKAFAELQQAIISLGGNV